LLHFRILLEFFDEPPTNPRYKDNLQFQWPKSYGADPSAAAIKESKTIAKELKDAWDEKLNKFLAHPTERRYTTKRSWPVEKMLDDMGRVPRDVEKRSCASPSRGCAARIARC
ncbi:MAG: hypothetical protein ACREKH_17170, partial [Candidatus Rokuibacteriota bacterium]